MTTIAYSKKLGTVSCDLLAIHQNIKFMCDTKFFLSEYFLLAAAGCAAIREAMGTQIEKIFNDHKNSEYHVIVKKLIFDKEKFDNSCILFIRHFHRERGCGICYIYAGGYFVKLEENIKALGSGLEFATPFMMLKPEEPTSSAVNFASTFDVYTGEKTKTFDLVKWEYV